MQPNRRALFAFAIPVALVVAFLIASIFSWIYFGLPSAKFDPLKMPAFFWYYRHDPVVLNAFGAGMGIGLFLAAITIWWFAKLKPPLHDAARFAQGSDIRRAGFRAANDIVLGKKDGKFLTFGGSEHYIVEAPTKPIRSADRPGGFNVGTSRFRGTVLADMLDAQGGHGSDVKDALLDEVRRGMTLTEDATLARARGKDYQFFVSGSATRTDLTGIAVPFGHDRDVTRPSDRVGRTAYCRVGAT